jgi:uncharacterized coiled-coil protein SlyX
LKEKRRSLKKKRSLKKLEKEKKELEKDNKEKADRIEELNKEIAEKNITIEELVTEYDKCKNKFLAGIIQPIRIPNKCETRLSKNDLCECTHANTHAYTHICTSGFFSSVLLFTSTPIMVLDATHQMV